MIWFTLSQDWQWNGFSPVWTRECRASSLAERNLCSHKRSFFHVLIILFLLFFITFLQTSHSCFWRFSLSCTSRMCFWTCLTIWRNLKNKLMKKMIEISIAECLYLSTLRAFWLDSRLVGGMDKLEMSLHVMFHFESLSSALKMYELKCEEIKTYENAGFTLPHCVHTNGRSSVWTCWMCRAKFHFVVNKWRSWMCLPVSKKKNLIQISIICIYSLILYW